MCGELLIARLAGDEGVEVRHAPVRLRTQHPPQSLRLLLPRTERSRYLNRHIRVRQVNGEVGDLRDDQRLDVAALERRIDLLALPLRRLPRDDRGIEPLHDT